jgi:preprotein translocase subunit Sss1
MSFRDQVKFLQELKRFEWKMTPKDKDEFKMFLKRENISYS